LGILLATLGYNMFDWIETEIDFAEEIRKGNIACAIVVGAFIVGMCIIIGRAVGS
jgi:uncharacterized membrane protein YjfL (UPF0719 family)